MAGGGWRHYVELFLEPPGRGTQGEGNRFAYAIGRYG